MDIMTVFALGAQFVISLTMMFMYRVSIPAKMIIGLVVSLITLAALPKSYDNIFDGVAWVIWSIVAIVSVLPFNIKRNPVETEDGVYYRMINNQTNWARGKSILSVWGVINKLAKPSGKLVGEIIPLNGRQSRYNKRKIVMNDLMQSGGTIITGSAGSGKTVTLVSCLSQDIKDGPVLLIDYKGEQDLINKVRQFTNKVTVIGSYELSKIFYDPFKGMNESSIIEAFLNMRKWDVSGSDGHYKTSLQAYLSDVVPNVLSQKSSEPFIMRMHNWMLKNQPSNRGDMDSYKTLKNLLSILLSSSFGKVFDHRYDKEFDLEKMGPGDVIILSFASDNKGIGTSVSSFILRDLMSKATAGKLKHGMNLYIDEFGSMEDKIIVKDLLEKGRSLGIKTLLSFQDIHQVSMDTNENYSKTIFGVVNTFIVHAGVTADSAKYYSGIVSSDDMLDQLFINLKKPSRGHAPTCVFITRYGSIKRDRKSELWLFTPFMNKVSMMNLEDTNQDKNESSSDDAPVIQPVATQHRQQIPHASEDEFETMSFNDIDKFLK